MTDNTQGLGKAIRVADRYVRAINIERDLPDPEALRGYRLTSRGEQALKRIFSGLHKGSTQRAWRLTGPYGGGKSSLALLLAALFEQRFSRRHRSGKLLHSTAPDLYALGIRALTYRPIVIEGHFDDASVVLAKRLLDTISQDRASAARKSLTLSLRQFIKSRAMREVPADEVLDLLDQFAGLETRSSGMFEGVLVVIDELGRFLDYTATPNADLDAGFFQALAERCAGKRDATVATIGILHQRFEDYARSSAAGDQSLEWRKVAERFEEVALEESVDGSLTLMDDAIECDIKKITPKTARAAASRVSQSAKAGSIPTELAHTSPTALYPLHPSAALALSVLSRRLGQTERSVFSFLSSQDVGGFQAFLAAHNAAPEVAFRLSNLCDYLLAHGHSFIVDTERNKRWSLLQDGLRGAPLHDETELNVLKTIGVLNLLEPLPSLECTVEQVSFAITDKPRNKAITNAINRLLEKNVVFVRRATEELCIWPRSSVDLAKEFRRAEQQVGQVVRLDSIIQSLPQPRPIVAHRHYIHTGTLRTLTVEVLPDIDSLEKRIVENDEGDGFLFVVPIYPEDSPEKIETALTNLTKSLSNGNVVATRYINQATLDVARDISVWNNVSQHCRELRVDAVAKDELDSALGQAKIKLNRELTGFLSFGTPDAAVVLFHEGKSTELHSSAELSRWVSELMDNRFPRAPVFHNELINRVAISTQAATARGRLLNAMLSDENKASLAIRKTPPEMALYRTLFRVSGMHRRVSEEWQFAPPNRDTGWIYAWEIATTLFTGTQPTALNDVVMELSKPPVGLREAPALVLCVTVLMANRYKLALSEDGSFITELTAPHLERMAKSPGRFEARLLPATDASTELVQVYRRAFAQDDEDTDIGDVLRALYRWYLGLPGYTLQTRSLPKQSRALLTTMSTAGEPIGLLREAVPDALEVKISDNPKVDQLKALEKALKKQVKAIDNALPVLIDRIQDACSNAFGLPMSTSLSDLRAHVASLCELAGSMPNEPEVSALRLRTNDQQRSDMQWLESIANLLTEQPPGSWEDDTLSAFDLSIFRLASILSRVAVLASSAKKRGEDPNSLIGIHIVDVSGRDRMLTVNTKISNKRLDDEYESVRAAIDGVSDPQRVLAQLLSEFALAESK